jgi:integrase
MAGKQAKILNNKQLAQLLAYASGTRYPLRNRVIILLSVKAGLRAGEIANLTWDMVLDPSGQISAAIELRDWAAKKNSGRTIPLHDDLATALASWMIETSSSGPVIASVRGGPMTPISIVNWFKTAYQSMGHPRRADGRAAARFRARWRNHISSPRSRRRGHSS